MTTSTLFWLALCTALFAYFLSAWCARLEQSLDRKAVLLDDPCVRHDDRTEGVVERLRHKGGC